MATVTKEAENQSFLKGIIDIADVDFLFVFWVGVIIFFIASLLIWIGRKGDVGYVFYIQVIGGFLMFAGSKIGRAFLGLE